MASKRESFAEGLIKGAGSAVGGAAARAAICTLTGGACAKASGGVAATGFASLVTGGATAGSAFPLVGTVIGATIGLGTYLVVKKLSDR